jgi:hypothetical protein
MGMHPYRRLESRERRFGIAALHLDLAEAAERTEMARLQIECGVNIGYRIGQITE